MESASQVSFSNYFVDDLGHSVSFCIVVASLHLKLLLQEMAAVAYVLYCTLYCLCIVHACLISMVLLPVIWTVLSCFDLFKLWNLYFASVQNNQCCLSLAQELFSLGLLQQRIHSKPSFEFYAVV